MAQIITNIVQNVGAGIGLASEAYKAHKANKTQPNADANLQTQRPSSDTEITNHDPEEEAWELDEAQDELISGYGVQPTQEVTDPGTLAAAFISRVPTPLSPADLALSREKLPFPIIIPQRRPADRSRGLIRAYPPILETRGIDQATFIDFIETFNKSTQAAKWIAALNLASIGTMWLPTVSSILVSMAIAAATTAAMEVQGRYKTNKFLDKINKEFFMPKGLFCLVLTWNPDTDDARTAVNFDGMAAKVVDAQNKSFMTSLRKSNGKTYGEFQWPETAPLIYPGLDALAFASDQAAQSTKSSIKKKRQFVDDYMDRRAQSKFAKDHPDSALAAGPKPEFASRFADPSHPANSGSLIALLSGGAMQMPERSGMLGGRGGHGNSGAGRFDRGRNAGFGRGSSGRVPLGRGAGGWFESTHVQAGSSNADKGMHQGLGASRGARGGSGAGPLGIVQKVMKKNVLYLLIVDMPSNEELAAAQEVASELLSSETRN